MLRVDIRLRVVPSTATGIGGRWRLLVTLTVSGVIASLVYLAVS